MCEDTEAANEIATRLNGDAIFKELNGRTINLHTNLKGKIKKEGKGEGRAPGLRRDEKEISDDDLRELRKLTRELDSDHEPVLLHRLRPHAPRRLGRAERHHHRPAAALQREGEHPPGADARPRPPPHDARRARRPRSSRWSSTRRSPASTSEELAQEGLDIEVVDVDHVPRPRLPSIPDRERKDVAELAIEIPRLTAANPILPALGPITEVEVARPSAVTSLCPSASAARMRSSMRAAHLITGEVVEHMKVNLTLLESGVGAISFFVREIESICKVRNTHQVLAPLLQRFFEEVLFGPGRSIFDTNLVKRLSDSDVREHVRATFVPIVRAKTLRREVRAALGQSASLANWKPFQVTSSERRPVEQSSRTLFNLVPCDRSLEVAFVEFCTRAPKSDVAAFAKNAGPQALRIDYLNSGGRLAFYTPDFFVRTPGGDHYLVETKGQQDADTAAKARAAIEWCKAASTARGKWTYLFIPEAVFQRFNGETVEQLESACRQSLVDLTDPHRFALELPLFATAGTSIMEERPRGADDRRREAARWPAPSRAKVSR